jgi:hypothetical protein
VSSSTLLLVFLAEGAVFGVVLAVGYPRLGPQHLTSALLAVGAALGVLWLVPTTVRGLAENPEVLRAALGLLFVPLLASVFWTSACFLRALARVLGPVVSRP